jgi:hypothetical protein
LPRQLNLISPCSSLDSKAPDASSGPFQSGGLPSAPRGALANTRIELRDIGFAYRPNEPVISRMSLSAARVYHELSAPLVGPRPDRCAGDIIMTGTPAGVAALSPGDQIECGVDGVGTLKVTIGKPA